MKNYTKIHSELLREDILFLKNRQGGYDCQYMEEVKYTLLELKELKKKIFCANDLKVIHEGKKIFNSWLIVR